jgi:hypothetical protein
LLVTEGFYMLTKVWRKIDRFYLILAMVLLVLAAPVIYTAQGIFSGFIIAFEIDPTLDAELRINKQKLDKAVRAVYDKNVPDFEISEAIKSQAPLEVVPEEVSDLSEGEVPAASP